MSSEETNTSVDVLTAFMLVVQRNGRVSVLTDDFPPMSLDHTADLFDVETFASQAAREAGRILSQRMGQPTAPPSTADRVSEALSRRIEES